MNKITMAILSKAIKGVLVICLALAVYKGASWAYDFGYGIFMDEAVVEDAQGRMVEVSLLAGSDAKTVGKELESLGIIRDDYTFYIQALLAGCNEDLQGGKYTLSNSMKPSEIMKILQAGPEESEK